MVWILIFLGGVFFVLLVRLFSLRLVVLGGFCLRFLRRGGIVPLFLLWFLLLLILLLLLFLVFENFLERAARIRLGIDSLFGLFGPGGLILLGLAFFGLAFFGLAFFGLAFFGLAFFGLAFFGLAFFGLAFFGLAFFGLAFFGLAFFGLAFFGLAFFGLAFFRAFGGVAVLLLFTLIGVLRRLIFFCGIFALLRWGFFGLIFLPGLAFLGRLVLFCLFVRRIGRLILIGPLVRLLGRRICGRIFLVGLGIAALSRLPSLVAFAGCRTRPR